MLVFIGPRQDVARFARFSGWLDGAEAHPLLRDTIFRRYPPDAPAMAPAAPAPPTSLGSLGSLLPDRRDAGMQVSKESDQRPHHERDLPRLASRRRARQAADGPGAPTQTAV